MGICTSKKQDNKQQQPVGSQQLITKGCETISKHIPRNSSPDSLILKPKNYIAPHSAQARLTVLLETYQGQKDRIMRSANSIKSSRTIAIPRTHIDNHHYKFEDVDFQIVENSNGNQDNDLQCYIHKFTDRMYYKSKDSDIEKNQQNKLISFHRANLVHPNIQEIALVESHSNVDQIYYEFLTGGTLKDFMNVEKILLQQVAILISQIIDLIYHLHQFNLYHNQLDLNSFSFVGGYNQMFIKLNDLPSLFNNNTQKSAEVDIQQIGMIALQLMNISFNLNDSNWYEQLRASFMPTDDILNINARSLILAMVQPNVNVRIKLSHIIQNQFIQQGRIEFLNYHKQKIIPKNCYKKINYLQKCFAAYLIEQLHPEQYLILDRIYQILEKDSEQNLNLISLCNYMHTQFPDQSYFIDYQSLIENQESICFRDFLILNINFEEVLDYEQLKKGFQLLSCKQQYICRKSMKKLMNADYQILTEQFAKCCLRWKFTQDHFINFMEKIR